MAITPDSLYVDNFVKLLTQLAADPIKYNEIKKQFINFCNNFKSNNNPKYEDIIFNIDGIKFSVPIQKLISFNSNIIKILLNNPYFNDQSKIEFLDFLQNSEIAKKLYQDFESIHFYNHRNQKRFEKTIGVENDINTAAKQIISFLEYCDNSMQINSMEENIIINKIDNFISKTKQEKFDLEINLKEKLFNSLSSSWVRETSDDFKKLIEERILLISKLETFKPEKKSMISDLYDNILFSKIGNINFVPKSYYFINSINMTNVKFAKKVLKTDENKISKLLLNEHKTFSDDYRISGNQYLFEHIDSFLNRKEDLFSILSGIDNKVLLNKSPHVDFIYKRTNFKIDFIESQFESYKEKSEQSLRHFVQFSFQNIYLMQELYRRKPDFYKKIKDTLFEFSKEKPKQEPGGTMVSSVFTLKTQFNTDNFIEMDQEFKEDYFKNINLIINHNKDGFHFDIDRIFEVIKKEPQLGNFIKKTTKLNHNLIDALNLYTSLSFSLKKDLNKDIDVGKSKEIEEEMKIVINNVKLDLF